MLKWLAALLFIALPASAQNPPLEGLKAYGCDVTKFGAVWQLEVWASHGAEKDWHIVLSRDASLDKSLRRCDKWFKALEKKTQPKGHK